MTPEQRERLRVLRYDVDLLLTIREANALEVAQKVLELIDILADEGEN